MGSLYCKQSTRARAKLHNRLLRSDVLLFALSEIIYESCLTLAENIPVEEPKSTGEEISPDVEDVVELKDIPAIYSGSPFTDRKSTFQAHLTEVHSEADLSALASSKPALNKVSGFWITNSFLGKL